MDGQKLCLRFCEWREQTGTFLIYFPYASLARVNTYYIILDIFLWTCPALRFSFRTSGISAPFVLRPAQDVAANVSKTLGENSRKVSQLFSKRSVL